MNEVEVEPVVQAALAALERARVGPGRYRRILGADDQAPDRTVYGTAAAANILYTLDYFPAETAERRAFVETLRSGQDRDTGHFSDPDHHRVHATANIVAALQLFDAHPLHPLTAVRDLLRGDAVEETLEGLDWAAGPWAASHVGAGSYAALHIVEELPDGAAERYFAWLWQTADPQTGLWRQGCQPGQVAGSAPLFHHLAGSFHYLFNHEAAGRPWRYPGALIDTALAVFASGDPRLGLAPGFAEIDWIYCLTRSVRLCGHRADEVDALLRAFTRDYAANLQTVVFEDLHALHGTVAALAELQQALPGVVSTDRPLRLTLDRRPFL